MQASLWKNRVCECLYQLSMTHVCVLNSDEFNYFFRPQKNTFVSFQHTLALTHKYVTKTWEKDGAIEQSSSILKDEAINFQKSVNLFTFVNL